MSARRVSTDIEAHRFLQQPVHVAVRVTDRKDAGGETLVLSSRGALKFEFFDGAFVDRRHAREDFGTEETW